LKIAIYKEGDANTVEVAKAIRGRVKALSKDLPASVRLLNLFDQARFIEGAVGEVENNALVGALLAILILFLFLRDVRSTMIIGLSIPISIMTTFVFMRQLGISLNIMSLGGLALGVGMLVDNSIVVLESISRHRGRSNDRKDATFKGAGEVGKAVAASTLTTVAVFLPIVFVEGIAGQIFKDQALTVSISLLASLVVALMLIPMISALQGRSGRSSSPSKGETENPLKKQSRIAGFLIKPIRFLFTDVPVFILAVSRAFFSRLRSGAVSVSAPVLRAFQRAYESVEMQYRPILKKVLSHKIMFLSGVFLLFCLSLLLLNNIGRELIPQFSQGEFSFSARLIEGSPLSATNRKISQMESIIESSPGVDTYFSTIGRTNRLGSNIKNKDKNVGQINVVLNNKNDKKAEAEIVSVLRNEFSKIEGISCKFSRPMYFTFQTPVEIDIFGYNLDLLQKTAEEVRKAVENIRAIKDVKSTMQAGNPELKIVFNRDKLAAFGLQLESVSGIMKNKIYGDVPTKLREMEREVDIRVRTSAWRTENAEFLKSLVVGENEGKPIYLGSVANITFDRGLNQITRISQQRAAVVTGNIQGRDLGSVSKDINKALAKVQIPKGISVELAGQNEELLSSFRSLLFALVLAVFLVYLVMASQFESFVHPFIIMFTVPMGLIGVFWTLFITGKSISVVVIIGAIMLSGIVVNNGIVLIDYINALRRRGASFGICGRGSQHGAAAPDF